MHLTENKRSWFLITETTQKARLKKLVRDREAVDSTIGYRPTLLCVSGDKTGTFVE